MASFYDKAAAARAARLAAANPNAEPDARKLGSSSFNRAEVADPRERVDFYPTDMPKNRRAKVKAKAEAKALAYHGPVQAIFPLTRRKGMEYEAFSSHWRNAHKTLVEVRYYCVMLPTVHLWFCFIQGFLQDLGAFKYEQLLSLPNPYEKRHGRPKVAQYDGTAILWWKDRKTKQEAGASVRPYFDSWTNHSLFVSP
jgi:hypothetical protein